MNEAPKNIQNIVEAIPSKAGPLMDHMRDLVQKLIDKSLLEFSYVHQLLYEYIWELHNQQLLPKIEDLINQLSEQLPKLLTTKPGAKASCILITYASAKDRKRMMKSLKSKVLESLLHASAHLGIIRLIQSTDDVVNVQKMILSEIKATQPEVKYSASGEMIGDALPPLVRIACSAFGSKWLLHLLAPPTDRILEPDEQTFFDLSSPTSKKTDASRRREHLLYLKSTLITVFSKHSAEVIRNRYATRVMYELTRVYYPARLIDSIARVSVGLEVADAGQDDALAEDDDDEEDEEVEEEADAYEEEIDGEEGEGNFENEEVAVDGEDGGEEDWDEFNDAANELLDQPSETDGGEPSKKKGKSKSEAQTEVASSELCSIEEDASAHFLIKKILILEATFGTDADSSNDKTLWESQQLASTSIRFASTLLTYLEQNDKLRQWLSSNRGCFALTFLLEVKEAQGPLKAWFKKHKAEVKKILSAGTSTNQGAKVLSQKVEDCLK